jgi:PAS domain S-box-containing protein
MVSGAGPDNKTDAPLYNSRLIENYLEFLKEFHPEIDIDSILKYAKISRYEIEDPAHWFTQHQVDRFQEILVTKSGNPSISREVGRYAASSKASGAVRQYTLGFISPSAAYWVLEKIASRLTRATTMKTRKLGRNKIEVSVTLNPRVLEKPYQCANRMGLFEALSKLFTNEFGTIEHPVCVHQGGDLCRYTISWERTSSLIWKRLRTYSLLLSVLVSLAFLFFLPALNWAVLTLMCVLSAMAVSLYSGYLEKKELTKTIETQGDAAKDLLDEMNMRYNDALLVQEIGQATSTILDIDELIEAVVSIMERHLDFDRGMIMLANGKKTRLLYTAGYGYSEEQGTLLRRTDFHLDNPKSKGVFVKAFREQKPFLLNDIAENKENFSKKSLELAVQMGVQSLICAPIIYEKESLGILAVDNIESKRPLTQSDKSLLMGVASQTALSIVNALSFQELQKSEKKYRDLVENANSIIMRMDTVGNITFFNEFAQRFFGYDEDEILGQNAADNLFTSSKSTKHGIMKLTRALQQDPDRQIVNELENVRRNSEPVWIAWTYKPIFDDEGRFMEILCIGNDITELKRAGKEKRELEAQLQRAQKMEAIGTLAGGVAHDLNNILSGLVSYPELLLMELPEDSALRNPVLTIQKSGEKAAAIVQDLLTLARRGVSATEVVTLNHIVSEYLKSPEHEKLLLYHPHVQVETHLETNDLNILGSPVHLSKTLMNLVSNAAEAMPNGGKITISTENRYVDRQIRGYDEVEEGDYLTLTVSDAGVGIAPEDMDRIFEPFYTKKVMGRSGTGLGMAVVWGAVKDHRGYIDVQSAEGKGTTFTLYFPVSKKEMVKDKSLLTIEDYMGQGESILVVDDVQEQREIVCYMLQKLGYAVTSVSSGEEAVNYLGNNSADLLVLDMIMDPGMDGLETYKRILEFHPGQKAIIASGFSETQRVREAQRLGAGSYIKKPYTLEKLGMAIKTELERQDGRLQA